MPILLTNLNSLITFINNYKTDMLDSLKHTNTLNSKRRLECNITF